MLFLKKIEYKSTKKTLNILISDRVQHRIQKAVEQQKGAYCVKKEGINSK